MTDQHHFVSTAPYPFSFSSSESELSEEEEEEDEEDEEDEDEEELELLLLLLAGFLLPLLAFFPLTPLSGGGGGGGASSETLGGDCFLVRLCDGWLLPGRLLGDFLEVTLEWRESGSDPR